ncbi:dethiobiotin synthetase [Idiomarina fontislapidosi]|uniref:ATP-dependent dethiobiotin synthetase BioD n=1 Tax=Idiomarina fontislapidosi TaxID=263723 RepID=A0A432Y9Q1_9GAMM|nr:dethiobiotin synthase [Idiomarina fontislapidosi]PYE34377.1 dethiobiotin synthetase [Idiomarina fontislapidosi]RUO57663.1 dethiobiotin synthase [Idiomarina fontislapidosi]|tara:strand:- start:1236 stop:1910 length:675 start_codon:yes stop_codon:yes gene_type:complete
MKVYFITGTDTDAGKTVVTQAVLQHLADKGLKTLAMKPVASGCEWDGERWINSDAVNARRHMTLECDYSLTNPYAFEPAIAPHIAAEEAGVSLSLEGLLKHFKQLADLNPDAIVVEGAGGWLLPLSEQLMMPEFVKAINAEVILTVGMKLGCLNHAMLTEQAIFSSSVPVLGWITNQPTVEPMARLEQNVTTLKHRMATAHLGSIAFDADWKQLALGSRIQLPD